MLDIEFLTAPRRFGGALIYVYRTGALKRELVKCIQSIARAEGRNLYSFEAAELPGTWSMPELFSSVRYCDLLAGDPSVLLELSVVTPATPTVVFIKGPIKGLTERITDEVVLLEEPLVTCQNLAAVLTFLEHRSDLHTSASLAPQPALVDYFDEWIEGTGEVSFPEVMQEFDRAVLLYSNLETGQFDAPPFAALEAGGRSYVVRFLRKSLFTRDDGDIAKLLRALSSKLKRGWSDDELTDDLYLATRKVLDGHSRPRRRKSTYAARDAQVATVLWGCMLLASYSASGKDLKNRASEAGHVLVTVDQLFREMRSRPGDGQGDPLKGYWWALSVAFKRNEDEDMTSAAALLVGTLKQTVADLGELPWLNKVRDLLQKSQGGDLECTPHESARLIRVSRTLADVLGEDLIINELRRRFERNMHARPLVIVGPKGSGKHTIVQAYARSLLCEGTLGPGSEPCGRCSACLTSDSSQSFGYIEIDGNLHPNATEHAREHIDLLRSSTLAAHRIVILKNVEAAVLDAFLKPFEDRASDTTFIVLAETIGAVGSATLSRSDVYFTNPLADRDAHALLAHFLPPNMGDARIADLIVLLAGGLPGTLLAQSQKLAEAYARSLDEAKSLFAVNWGSEVLKIWHWIFQGNDHNQSEVSLHWSLPPTVLIHSMRIVLKHLGGSEVNREPALLGLEQGLANILALMDERCHEVGVTRRQMWTTIASLWASDGIIGANGLYDAVIATRAAVFGEGRWPHVIDA